MLSVLSTVIVLMAVQGPSANYYALDGNPTGLTSSHGSVSVSGNTYSGSGSGTGAEVVGPAKFKFKWVPDVNNPEPPPESVVISVQVITYKSVNPPTSGSCKNGWTTTTGMGSTANEVVVISNPGEDFEYDVDMFSKAGGGTGFVSASATVTATPVLVNVAGITWVGSAPKTAKIQIGESATGSLSTGGYSVKSNSHSWTIGGDYFKNWYVNGEKSVYKGPNDVDKTVASPAWYWKDSGAPTVTCSAKLNVTTNVHNPNEPDIQDSFELTVVKPTCDVDPLTFDNGQPTGTAFANGGTNWANITTTIGTYSGTVTEPSGFGLDPGSFGFCQVIVSSSRSTGSVSNALDGTFPYAYQTQNYECGQSASFIDVPFLTYSLPPGAFADDSFSNTIMFRSAAFGSCWVPLKESTWSWNASLTNNTVPFQGPIGSHSSSSWSDTSQFPSWRYTVNLN